MSRTMLDLLHERIEAGLSKANHIPLLHFLGSWLGVLEPSHNWKRKPGLREYMDVAECAVAYAVLKNDEIKSEFQKGLNWLLQRNYFIPNRPQSIEADPIALLGLAVGVSTLCQQEAKGWLLSIIRKAIKHENEPERLDFFCLAKAILESTEDAWESVSPLLRVSVLSKFSVSINKGIQESVLTKMLSLSPISEEQAVFYAAAIRELFHMEAVIDIAQPTINQIVALLKGVPAALKRWPWEKKPMTKGENVTAQKWGILHEYHVQSLLWAILRPFFPDLEDEESLPSVGHKPPRADLLIPNLKLVIEVKYLRSATQAARAKITEEIAADSALYLADPSLYTKIVVFIWDASISSHHHAEIVGGLQKLNGIAETIIVPCPGEWKNP